MSQDLTRKYSWKSISPRAQVFYLSSLLPAEHQLSRLLASRPRVLGLDIEWKPNYVRGETENPVALVQLANDEFILLIHLSSMKTVPPSLTRILASSSILKCGVGISGDAQKLFKDMNISPIASCLDLGLFAKSIDNARWKGKYKDPVGLSRLAQAYYGAELVKGKVQRSNWENQPLTTAQIDYASNDAHAGYSVYMAISSLPPPPIIPLSKCYSFDVYNGRMYETSQELPLPESADDIPSSTAATSFPAADGQHPSWDAGDINFASLVEWKCVNPDYDPGPPPPPRVPKPKADGTAGEGSNATSAVDSNTQTNKRQRRDQARARQPPAPPFENAGLPPRPHWTQYRPNHPPQSGSQPSQPQRPRRHRGPRNDSPALSLS